MEEQGNTEKKRNGEQLVGKLTYGKAPPKLPEGSTAGTLQEAVEGTPGWGERNRKPADRKSQRLKVPGKET